MSGAATSSRARCIQRIVALAALLMLAPCALAQEIFVPNLFADSVTVHAMTADGNVAPLRTISGAATELSRPTGIAIDAVHNEIFVANFGVGGVGTAITVYPLGASGNVAPLRRITSASALLTEPYGIAVDPAHDELFVANNTYPGRIVVYPRTVSGAAPPKRMLSGAAAGFTNPIDVAVDTANDELLVLNNCNSCGSSINVYARTAAGNTAPTRKIGGGLTQIANPVGLLADATHDEILVTDTFYNAVRVFARGANGDVAPKRSIVGALTDLAAPYGLALDAVSDELVVANLAGDRLTQFARTANGNFPPNRVVSGSSSGLNGPYFVAIAPASAPIAPLTVTTASPLPGGSVGLAHLQSFAAAGGTPPYHDWKIIAGTLPPGLNLSTGGVLAGTPAAAGTYTFTVQVSDSAYNPDIPRPDATASKNFSLAIAAAPTSVAAPAPLAAPAALTLFALALAAAGAIALARQRKRSNG